MAEPVRCLPPLNTPQQGEKNPNKTKKTPTLNTIYMKNRNKNVWPLSV